MTRIRCFLVTVGLAVLMLLPGPLWAQTALTSTTLSAAVALTDNAVSVTSATNISVGHLVVVDHEAMRVTAITGTRLSVARGQSGTSAEAHANAAVVYAGATDRFAPRVPSGTCVSADQPYQPHIVLPSARWFECFSGTWMELYPSNYDHPRQYADQDNFDRGYFIFQDDMTAKSVSDDEDNIVNGSPLGIIEYREELGKTASSWLIADGLLDISADDGATDAEGVEIAWGVAEGTDMGYIVAGTQGACIEASIDIVDVSGTDFTLIGWRQNEAFVDNATPASYTLYNLVGIYNVEDGSILSVESGATSDDSGVNWADNDTRALKVCISKAGVPSAFYSAAYTHSQVINEYPAYTQISNVNNGTTLTAGTQMVPFLTFLYGNDLTNADVRVNWVRITRLP